MQTASINAAVLLVVGDRWMKVAMVIAKVVGAMSRDLPTGVKHGNWFPSTLRVL
jgi:hypothetical protein